MADGASDPGHIPEREIRVLIVDDFNEKYFARVQHWLSGLGCLFTETDGIYRIEFPPGTTEAVCPGMSSPWTYVTAITIPGAKEPLIRIQAQRLSTGKIANHLGLPKFLMEER